MKALFLTKYSRRGASSRYRALQYVPLLRRSGWDVTVEPLFPDEYLERLYEGRGRSPFKVLEALGKRLRLLNSRVVRRFDVTYVHAELLPSVPFALESPLYNRLHPFVVDYDDATFVPYRGSPILGGKIDRIVASADQVIVGNRFLKEYACRHNQHVTLIPTVIDVTRYRARSDYSLTGPVVIGWIGTPVTVRFLESVKDCLRELSSKYQILVRTIGGPPGFSMPGVRVENLPWSEDTEAEHIRSFDVGIMPLSDEPFAHGKCGFKLIQYMGCGVPALGSSIGANRDIIRDGENGLLASNVREFVAKLSLLIDSEELRGRLGRAGRTTVETDYSLETHAARFMAVLAKTRQGMN